MNSELKMITEVSFESMNNSLSTISINQPSCDDMLSFLMRKLESTIYLYGMILPSTYFINGPEKTEKY